MGKVIFRLWFYLMLINVIFSVYIGYTHGGFVFKGYRAWEGFHNMTLTFMLSTIIFIPAILVGIILIVGIIIGIGKSILIIAYDIGYVCRIIVGLFRKC